MSGWGPRLIPGGVSQEEHIPWHLWCTDYTPGPVLSALHVFVYILQQPSPLSLSALF